MAVWRYEISLLVLKKYFTSERSEWVKYFSTLKEKFCISARPCNILYLYRTVHCSMGWNISSPVHNFYDKIICSWLLCHKQYKGCGSRQVVLGGSGVNGLKVVNLLILLNSKTIEVRTQHLLAFLRPSKSIWQRLEWRENKLFWLAGKCFGWWCNCIQIVGPDRWKRVSQPLNCEYFHSVIYFIL